MESSKFPPSLKLRRTSKIQISKLVELFIAGLISVLGLSSVYAQAVTISPTATTTVSASEEKDIQSLKDKIATKVAEMRQENNKAVSGFVESMANETIKIKTASDDEYGVKIDSQLTKFYQIVGNQKNEVNESQIKKGMYIIATGLLNDKTVDANFIYIDQLFEVGSGQVTEVNKTDFYIKVVTLDKDNLTLDIETFTKEQMLNIKTLELEKVGFSKIKEGDNVHFVYNKTGNEKEPNRFSAQKITVIPQEYFSK